MDAQLELVMQAISALRTDNQRGFDGLNGRLDKLNGQVATHGQKIAVLEERTEDMVCAEHSATFRQLQADVSTLQMREKPSHVGTALTSGGVAGFLIVLQGVWAWWQGKP